MKKKLLMAVVMLTLSILMMTSASFAWFTISTNPEISALTTQVVVNENLEIALAATGAAVPAAAAIGNTGNQYTWGNIIDLAAVVESESGIPDAKGFYTALDKTLRPAALAPDKSKFQYPTYGSDGRVSILGELPAGTMANGFGNLTVGGKFYGYYVDFYLQSNNAGAVTLSTGVDRSSAGELGGGSTFTAGGTGLASAQNTLAKNIRIAFQPGATGPITAMTTTTPSETTATTATFSGTVASLTANTPQLVRMFVYLDGLSVTNAAASLADGVVSGALNIQFDMASVGDSMDAESIT
ncbi:MAG: hypothetical protein EOM70_08170 [Clostridia bacterium]|nr:hypothetical protein [Clostridia bacterium]